MKPVRGYVHSDRKSTAITREELRGAVDRGIHVFLKRSDARNAKISGEFVMPVRCRREDLVVGGWALSYSHQAVYMKVGVDAKLLANKSKRLHRVLERDLG